MHAHSKMLSAHDAYMYVYTKSWLPKVIRIGIYIIKVELGYLQTLL